MPPEAPDMAQPEPYLTWFDRSRAALRSRWRLAAVVFAALVVLGGVYVLTIPTTYVSNGVISFQPRLDESNGRDLTALLAERYPAYLSSSTALAGAATAAGVTTGQVEAGLVAAVEPATLNMQFSVTLSSSQQAQAAAGSLYLSTLEYNITDPYLEALRVETPTPAVAVAGIPKPFLLSAVVLLAALTSTMAALVVNQLSARE